MEICVDQLFLVNIKIKIIQVSTSDMIAFTNNEQTDMVLTSVKLQVMQQG